MKHLNLRIPTEFLALDIETSELIDRTKPDRTRIAIVGVQRFEIVGNRMRPREYRCFSSAKNIEGVEPISELLSTLLATDCPIVGHNLYDFDLRVLNGVISVKDIVGRCVDTLALAYLHNTKLEWYENSRSDLSLNSLAHENLGLEKTHSGKSIPKMWRDGKFEDVIEYNKNDLVMTAKLWWHFLKKKHFHKNGTRINFPENDMFYISGQTPLLTYERWNALLKQHGTVLRQIKDGGEGYIFCKCKNCSEEMLAQSFKRDWSARSKLFCPFCGDSMGEMDFDTKDVIFSFPKGEKEINDRSRDSRLDAIFEARENAVQRMHLENSMRAFKLSKSWKKKKSTWPL
jgi:hypothetical protein